MILSVEFRKETNIPELFVIKYEFLDEIIKKHLPNLMTNSFWN